MNQLQKFYIFLKLVYYLIVTDKFAIIRKADDGESIKY